MNLDEKVIGIMKKLRITERIIDTDVIRNGIRLKNLDEATQLRQLSNIRDYFILKVLEIMDESNKWNKRSSILEHLDELKMISYEQEDEYHIGFFSALEKLLATKHHLRDPGSGARISKGDVLYSWKRTKKELGIEGFEL